MHINIMYNFVSNCEMLVTDGIVHKMIMVTIQRSYIGKSACEGS